MLIARRLEISSVLAELSAAGIEQRVGTVLLRGPAGIGKSTIVSEILRHSAEARGFPLLGRADGFDRGAPFGVFRDAFSRLRPRDLPAPALDALAAVRESLDVRSLTGDGRSVQLRRDRILLALADLLPHLTEAGPTVLALEDLHAADPDSLALVGLLGRNIADVPMLLLLSCRNGYDAHLGALDSFLGRLSDDGRATVIDLAPLARPAIAELLADSLGQAQPASVLDVVLRSSGGNPFFAQAMADRMADGADPTATDLTSWAHDLLALQDHAAHNSADVPNFLARFFGARDGEFDAASALSVFGKFGLNHLPLLQSVTGQSERQAVAHLDRLIAKILLVRTINGYEFAHPILKDLLYADLGEARRRSTHRQVAGILARRQAGGHEVDAFELAAHAYAAGHFDDDLALDSCLAAASSAADVAPLVAVGWFDRALELMRPSDLRRSQIHARRVYSLILASQTTQAIEASRTAFAELPYGVGHVALSLSAAGAMFAGDHLEEALAVIKTEMDCGTDLPWLWSMRVALLGQLGRPNEIDADGTDSYLGAMSRVRNCDRPLETASAAILLMTHSALIADTANYTVFDGLMRAHLDSVPLLSRAELLHMAATLAVEGVGGIRSAEDDLAAARALVGRRPMTSAGGTAELSEILVAYYTGRWDDALDRVAVAAPALRDCGSTTVLIAVRAVAVLLLTDRGEFDAALTIGADLQPGPFGTRPLVAVARSRLAGLDGNHHSAVAILQEQADRAHLRGHLVMSTLVTEELASVLLRAGRTNEAIDVSRRGDELAKAVQWPLLSLYADRTTAAVCGDLDAARRAAVIASDQGAPVELARCRVILGELGDDSRTNLQAALTVFRSVGAVGWARRAENGLRTFGLLVPHHRAPVNSANGLTRSETALARLAVEGLSNRQIAAALNYSARTVETYLSKIYAKLGVSGRIDLIRSVMAGRIDLGDTRSPTGQP